MKNFVRLLLASTLLVSFASTIGCGSPQPTVVTEGMTDAELEAYGNEIDAKYAAERAMSENE